MMMMIVLPSPTFLHFIYLVKYASLGTGALLVIIEARQVMLLITRAAVKIETVKCCSLEVEVDR